MRRGSKRKWWVVAGSAALVTLVGLLALASFQPVVANHFGYALPGRQALPSQFSYQGISYSNPNLCAGASWCNPSAAVRWSRADLDAHGLWPLKQVASIATLMGQAHPLLEPANDLSMTGAGRPYASDVHPFVLLVRDGAGGYFIYTRPGGP
jgi:hypothetical protein